MCELTTIEIGWDGGLSTRDKALTRSNSLLREHRSCDVVHQLPYLSNKSTTSVGISLTMLHQGPGLYCTPWRFRLHPGRCPSQDGRQGNRPAAAHPMLKCHAEWFRFGSQASRWLPYVMRILNCTRSLRSLPAGFDAKVRSNLGAVVKVANRDKEQDQLAPPTSQRVRTEMPEGGAGPRIPQVSPKRPPPGREVQPCQPASSGAAVLSCAVLVCAAAVAGAGCILCRVEITPERPPFLPALQGASHSAMGRLEPLGLAEQGIWGSRALA
jgi:hypothetical protein